MSASLMRPCPLQLQAPFRAGQSLLPVRSTTRSARHQYRQQHSSSAAQTGNRRPSVLARDSDRGPGAFGGSDGGNDLVFVAKLVAISFGGAAAIKYGSLLSDVPFDADSALAMSLVLGPPMAYAALMWTQPRKGE